MKRKLVRAVVFLLVSSILTAQEGQANLYEYKAFSRGGNSSYVGVETSGLSKDQVELVKTREIYNVPSHHKQSNLLEYKTSSLGGSSSFVAAETNGMTEVERGIIKSEANGHSLNDEAQLIEYRERASRMNSISEEVINEHVTGQPGYRAYFYTQKNCTYDGCD